MWLDFDVRHNRRCTFSLEEALLLIMDYIWVKNVLMLDLFQLLSSQYANWWTGVVWIIVMFLSDSHSDGTHSLQSIHCWDTDAVIHFSKSDEETNSSSSWMAWGWAHFQQMFIFKWTSLLSYLTLCIEVCSSVNVMCVSMTAVCVWYWHCSQQRPAPVALWSLWTACVVEV